MVVSRFNQNLGLNVIVVGGSVISFNFSPMTSHASFIIHSKFMVNNRTMLSAYSEFIMHYYVDSIIIAARM